MHDISVVNDSTEASTSSFSQCCSIAEFDPVYRNKKAGKMLSDFALAILALVFIFALGCIMVERRNDTSGAVKSKTKPRKRKRKTRRHYDDTRREAEENTDGEGYNMH